MVDFAKVVVDKYVSGALNTRRVAKPIKAQINIDGERVLDTATIELPISVDCDNGYEVRYIQDVADLSGLVFICNFQDQGTWQFGKLLSGSSTALSNSVSTMANNGSGLIRVTTTATHNFITGSQVTIYGVVGTTEANGTWIITKIDGTHFDLQSSTFTNAYVSGGKITGMLKIVDESGYDMDGYSVNSNNRYSDGDSGRILFITNSGDEVIIPDQKFFDNSTNAVGSTPMIDFSGMFDIYIRFSCSDTGAANKFLLDKEDGTNGLSIYVSAGATGVTKVDAVVGGVISNITGTVQINDGVVHTLRIKRDVDNIIRLFVDNVADGTVSTSSNYTNNTANLIIGNNYAGNRIATNSKFSQVRIYCQQVKSDDQNNLIWAARRQFQTMKFGGIVWQKLDGTDFKTVMLKSYAKIFGETYIQPQNFNNVYGTVASNVSDKSILQDLIRNYTTDWSMSFTASTTNYPRYVAQGSILINLQTFMPSINGTLFTTPRKTISFESLDQQFSITNLYPFVNGIYDVNDDGKDDTGLVNYLEVVGATSITNKQQTFTGDGTTKTFTISNTPFSMRITDNGTYVAGSAYTIDYENKQVTFSVAPLNTHTIIIEFDYLNAASNSNLFYRTSDSTSITANGFHGKRITLSGIYDLTSLSTFATNYMSRFSTLNQRVVVNSPFPIPFARYNLQVKVTNSIKGISNVTKTIKSYTVNYPEMTTVLNLGDYIYDFYDFDSAYATTLNQTTTAYINTKAV